MSAAGMPPYLLALFVPRPPTEFLPAIGEKKKPIFDGIAAYAKLFEDTPPPPVEPFETPKERRERRKKEKLKAHKLKQKALIGEYDPNAHPNTTRNPFATLFIGRMSYETSQKKLKREFETFGPIRKIRVVTDNDNKPRGYAFIEFEHEEDMKKAYKRADGRKIDGRRILVDVERARTVPGWLPRRLGGGKGPARFTAPKVKGSTAAAAPFAGGSAIGGSSGGIGMSRGPPPSFGGPPRDGGYGGPPRDGGYGGPPRDGGYGGPPRDSFGGGPPRHGGYGGGGPPRDMGPRTPGGGGGGGSGSWYSRQGPRDSTNAPPYRHGH